MNEGRDVKEGDGCDCRPGRCDCDPEQHPTCLCPVYGIIDVVSKKWTICIVSYLSDDRPKRFNDIKRGLGKISPRSLSNRLKELERHGLIYRNVYPEIPPKVEYSLSEKGCTLRKSLLPLVDWVRTHEEGG